MAANNYTKYDEDFKNPLSHFTRTAKHNPSSAKNTAFPNPLLANGSSNTPPLKWMTAMSSPLNRSKNFKNATLSWKRRTLS